MIVRLPGIHALTRAALVNNKKDNMIQKAIVQQKWERTQLYIDGGLHRRKTGSKQYHEENRRPTDHYIDKK